MEGGEKVFVYTAVLITLLALAGIANNFYTDKLALEHGLHQQQAFGQSSFLWVK